jgi:hypothetical protein
MVSGLFKKKRNAISPHPAPPQALAKQNFRIRFRNSNYLHSGENTTPNQDSKFFAADAEYEHVVAVEQCY